MHCSTTDSLEKDVSGALLETEKLKLQLMTFPALRTGKPRLISKIRKSKITVLIYVYVVVKKNNVENMVSLQKVNIKSPSQGLT